MAVATAGPRRCMKVGVPVKRLLTMARPSYITAKGRIFICRVQSPQAKQAFELDITPYLLWTKAVKLTAYWDAASSNKEYLQHLEQQLELQDADDVRLFELSSPSGRTSICLSLSCHPRNMTEVSATLLQMTPAMEVHAAEGEVCGLPRTTVTMDTQWGPVQVNLSLAGSTAYKAAPCWRACEAAAAAAGDPQVTPPVVAHQALTVLKKGLQDGTLDLGLDML